MPSFRATSPEEIQRRVRKGYLDRLDTRVRRMRMLLAERDWPALRVECAHLKNTATGFGFRELSELAGEVEKELLQSDSSRAVALPQVRIAAEALLTAIDRELERPRSRGMEEGLA